MKPNDRARAVNHRTSPRPNKNSPSQGVESHLTTLGQADLAEDSLRCSRSRLRNQRKNERRVRSTTIAAACLSPQPEHMVEPWAL